jgi:DNA-binding NarL/FixJ family response regulator
MAGDAQLFPRPLHPELSFRELQVMQGYAAGKGSKEIASELSVSIKTVSTYRNRLLGKLRLRNNADLVLYAFHNDLLQSGAGGTRSTAAGR